MKRKIIKSITAAFLVLVLLIGGAYGFVALRIYQIENKLYPVPENANDLPEVEMVVDYAFDISDKRKAVGFSDNVFLGFVDECRGTMYDNVFLSEKTLHFTGFPTTYYTVCSVEDIKGETAKEKLNARVSSGVSLGGKTVEKLSGNLPEKGKLYIFLCKEDKDGSLIIWQNIFLAEAADMNNYALTEEAKMLIEEYKDAYEHQDLSVS